MTTIKITTNDGVAHLSLDGARRRNALSESSLAELGEAIAQLRADPTVRAVVLSGDGPVFCAGADLKAFEEIRHDQPRLTAWERDGAAAFQALASLPVPVVCAIQGGAYGGGFELALHADFRVMAPDAILTLPEVRSGWLPAWGGLQRLPAVVAPALAAYLLATSERLDAERALSWGLTHEISDEPVARSVELAAALAEVEPALLAAVLWRPGADQPARQS